MTLSKTHNSTLAIAEREEMKGNEVKAVDKLANIRGTLRILTHGVMD